MTFFIIPKSEITLLLLILSISSSMATAAFFRDVDGNPVVNGGSYHIHRDMMAPDEGPITWGTSNNSRTCPLYVIQSHYIMTDPPTPNNIPYVSITFRSPQKSKYIQLGATVDLYFNNPRTTPCKKTLKWSVKSAKPINAYYLVAGDDNPLYKGSFKVIDAGSGSNYVYRFVYCFNNVKSCFEVGNANAFVNREILGITSQPKKLNFWALDFSVSKA